MNASRIALMLALAGVAAVAQAADPAAGRAKVEQVCAACHGVDGNSQSAQYPILAGQHLDYIKKALHDYQNGSRKNAIMAGMAAGLSDADIENLAAYFAAQKTPLNQTR